MTQEISCETPQAFFDDILGKALARQRVHLSDSSRAYVVLTLASLANPDKEMLALLGEPLAELYLEGMHMRAQGLSHIKGIERLKLVGDASLFTAGFYFERQPHWRSSGKYYVQLGRLAYRSLGGIPFEELAKQFRCVVGALMEVSTRTSISSARGLLHLYDVWQKTQIGVLAVVLKDADIETKLQLRRQ